jgi:hypothetical protein
MTDNGRQFVSREFEQFAKEWNFEHITSSPFYPKSNGLAENAVKQAKQLLEKSMKDGSDVMLGLLNLRNTPRENMGSPAQRLLSRRTRTTLPTSTKLLQPKSLNTAKVRVQLKAARQRKKRYHDKTTRKQRPLEPNQVVRMQTDKGFQKLAVVKSQRDAPRSYVVTSDGTDYVRNRQHLLPVNEPRPSWGPIDFNIPSAMQSTPASVGLPAAATMQQRLPAVTPSPPHAKPPQPRALDIPQSSLPFSQLSPKPTPQLSSMPAVHPATSIASAPQSAKQPVITRYGRVVKPNPKYNDT